MSSEYIYKYFFYLTKQNDTKEDQPLLELCGAVVPYLDDEIWICPFVAV
jgi:hypothetical protein